ncbi:hypothetical protein KKH30_02825, partial [Candidatus Micrarchaeota archaeon]|nr:hypothetical protein [Candidatus Micrarchaeota archaeon]
PVPVRQTPVQAKAKPALKKPLPAQPKPLPQKAAQAPRKPFPVPATEQAPVPVRIVESKPAAVKPVPAKPEPAKPKLEKPAVPLTKPGLQAVSKPKTEPPVLEKQEIPNGGLSKGILSKKKSATMLKPVRKPVPLPPKPAQQKPILPKPKSPPQKPAMQAVKKFEVKAENVVVKGKDEPVTKPAQDPDSKDHSFKIMSQREKIAQWAEERRARLNQDREKQKRIAGNLDEGTEEHDAAPATPAKADTVQEPLPKQGEAQEKTGNLRSLFKGKPANKSEEERIAGLEERMTALMQKHNVSSNEVKREAMAIDAPSVVGSFNKLIGLLESKYEGTSGGMYRGGRGGGAGRESLPNTTSLGMDAMLKRQAAETATPTDLKKKRIVTDFDRTLSLVTEREKIRISEIASELNISSGRVEECCDILERGNLIEIHYPAIGKPYVQVANYAELRAAQKEQEKDAKPKKKGAGKNV